MDRKEIKVLGLDAVFTEEYRRDSRSAKSLGFVWIEDETIIEHLMNRRNRPSKLYRVLLESALLKLDIEFEKIQWSQHAGCSMCACSPGFIITGPIAKVFSLTLKQADSLKNNGYQTPLEAYGVI